jgi:hypothetical protein
MSFVFGRFVKDGEPPPLGAAGVGGSTSSAGGCPPGPGPLDAAPPPEAPAEKRARKVEGRLRADIDPNPTWDCKGGYIRHDVDRLSLDAHCTNPLHADATNPCRLNRKRRGHGSGRQTAQGRPLGTEFLWLELGDTVPTREQHVNMLKPRAQTPDDVEAFSFENRLGARLLNAARPELKDLFILERDPWLGEGDEPEAVP